MWLVTNEPDYNNYTPQQVTQLIQEVLYCGNQAGIPDADQLPIAVPLSYSTNWAGYSNPTPGVSQVEALYNAFTTSTPFSAATNHANPSQVVTVPALPANFFTTRFVWAINPIGNDIDYFLGEKTNPAIFAPYNNPVSASSSINWNSIPLVFTELGPNSVQYNQPVVLKHQLDTVKWAETSGQDPTFDGAMIFQSLDQTAHKSGPEAHWGIQKFDTGVYQTITDVPPTPGLSNGSPVSNLTWRLDTLVHKPAYTIVKNAFT